MTNWLLIFVTSSHCFEWQLILPSLLNCKTRYSLTTFQYFQLTGWSILLSWEIAYVQMSAWLAAVISKLKKTKILLIFSRLIRLCFVGYESGGNVFCKNIFINEKIIIIKNIGITEYFLGHVNWVFKYQ